MSARSGAYIAVSGASTRGVARRATEIRPPFETMLAERVCHTASKSGISPPISNYSFHRVERDLIAYSMSLSFLESHLHLSGVRGGQSGGLPAFDVGSGWGGLGG